MKHSVQVTILGQVYPVRSAADPEEVLQVAEFANRRIREAQDSSGAANSHTAVVLALLNIAGELFQLQKQGREAQVAEQRLKQLLTLLERACPGQEPGA